MLLKDQTHLFSFEGGEGRAFTARVSSKGQGWVKVEGHPPQIGLVSAQPESQP